LTVGGNVIILNANASGSPIANAELIVNRGTEANAILRWDESIDEWTIQEGDVSGHILHHRKTATTWEEYEAQEAYEKLRYPIGGTLSNTINEHAKAGFNEANTATAHAVGGFIQANSAYLQANTGTQYAQSAGTYANAAYVQANTATQYGTSAGAYANAAYVQANTATQYGTSAGAYANAAYVQANTATQYATSAGAYANAAYVQANTATQYGQSSGAYANAAYSQANTANTRAYATVLKSGDTMTGQLVITTVGAPLSVSSNALVANLNADLLDSLTSASFANAAFTNTVSQNASSAGTYANAAYTQANTATQYGTSAGAYANAAYSQANTATQYGTSAGAYANASFATANTANVNAISAGTYANAGYTQANTANINAISAGAYANAAYNKANSAGLYANSAFDTANTKLYNFYQNTAPTSSNTHDIWTHSDTGVVYENFGTTISPIWAEFGPTSPGGSNSSAAFSTTNINVAYTPASTIGTALTISAANTIGGTGYADAIKITNTSGGATNPNKTIRMNNTGAIEIIDSNYGNTLFNLSNAGDLTIKGSLTIQGRPAFRVVGNGGSIVSPQTVQGGFFTVDYNQGSYLNTSTGIFTAPISGLYQVNLVVRTNSNSLGTISQAIIRKTAITGGGVTTQIMIEFGANTSMNHTGGSTIVKMEAGDTLKFDVTVGTLSFDGNDNWSVAYIG
jgi:hypothetical protein